MLLALACTVKAETGVVAALRRAAIAAFASGLAQV